MTVEAKDVAGNGPTVSSARTIVVDNHPPTVALDSPGAAVRGTVALTTTTSADTTRSRSSAALPVPESGRRSQWTTRTVQCKPRHGACSPTVSTTCTRSPPTAHGHIDSSRRGSTTRPRPARDRAGPGATVGGPSVTLGSNAADSGSGVATVGSGSTAPRSGRRVRAVGARLGSVLDAERAAHDRRGRHRPRGKLVHDAGRPVTVDSTPPAVTLADPGTPLSGSVSSSADLARPGHRARQLPGEPGRRRHLDDDRERHDAAVLRPASTRAVSPTVSTTCGRSPHDSVGNASAPSVVAARRIDNTAPSFVSATPTDGST